jgi:hypothetical protein
MLTIKRRAAALSAATSPGSPGPRRSRRGHRAWDWLANAALLGGVLVLAGIFVLAAGVSLLGYLVPVPSVAMYFAVRTVAVLVGLACLGAVVVVARAVRSDSRAPYESARLTPADDIPVVGVLGGPVRMLLSALEPEGGLTASRRR